MDISEVTPQCITQPLDLISLARAVHILAPEDEDNAVRVGLIHAGFNRQLSQTNRGEADCLGQALRHCGRGATQHDDDIRKDLARVAALVFSICAGDIPDPTLGADLVFTHDVRTQMPEFVCTALLGNFLFFKKSPMF